MLSNLSLCLRFIAQDKHFNDSRKDGMLANEIIFTYESKKDVLILCSTYPDYDQYYLITANSVAWILERLAAGTSTRARTAI